MKTGIPLMDLANELKRQEDTKKDYVADTQALHMQPDTNALEIGLSGGPLIQEVTPITHRQISAHTGIPAKYYDACPADLRAVNVNHWLKNTPAKRMVRCLDGKVRAFLSDKYRQLDNFDLANAVIPILQDQPDMKIVSCQLTDYRMYIKALFPRIEREVAEGDVVQSGLVISNSEVGHGSLKVEPLVYRLVCRNGMISNIAQRRYHVGSSSGIGDDEAAEFYRDETREANDKAFWMKVQDTVRAAVDESKFDKIVEGMRETMGLRIEGDPVKAVEEVQNKFGFTDDERGSVLNHLIQGGDLSAYGVLNALTRTSQDIEDYERATEFERLGGKVIELSRDEWRTIAQAA